MRYRNQLITGLFSALLACLVTISSFKASADVVKERQKLMKTIAKSNKLIRAAAENGNSDIGSVNAQKLILAAQKFVQLFPKGTDRGSLDPRLTRSKPEIWSQWSQFKMANDTMIQIAENIFGGDLSGVQDLTNSCRGCHRKFRGSKVR